MVDDNKQVFIKMKIGNAETELRIMRLHFWQLILRQPEHHRQLITSFFGQFDFDKGNGAVHLHGRYKQLKEDMEKLSNDTQYK